MSLLGGERLSILANVLAHKFVRITLELQNSFAICCILRLCPQTSGHHKVPLALLTTETASWLNLADDLFCLESQDDKQEDGL